MRLYYVHDPMCSWCWGFRPCWEKIRFNLPENIELRYLLGGLSPDSQEPMPTTMQQDIAGYWRKIQQTIPGTEFNFDFWDNCIPKRSTYPACRAVIAARKQDPQVELAMIEAIQKAYYLEAKNPSDDDTLIALAENLGLDNTRFKQDLNANETQQELEREIQFGRHIGAQGFPSLILENEGHYQRIPIDYNQPGVSLALINSQS